MKLTALELHGLKVGDGLVSRRKTKALLAEDGPWMLGR